jgi:hypothetical protein
MMRLLRMTPVALFILLLSGCATLGPKFEAAPEGSADKAMIYVYREAGFIGGGVSYMVRVNDADVSTLPAGGYFLYLSTPGEVEISAKTEAKTSVTLDAKAGQTYYIKGTIGVGVFVGHPHLTVVDNEIGAAEIAKCSLVPDARTEAEVALSGPRMETKVYDDTIVEIAPSEVIARAPAPGDLPVSVVDLRSKVVMERTTIGHIDMGKVVLRPNEVQLLQAVLEAVLNELPTAQRSQATATPVSCQLKEFAVTTPASVMYWDATTDISLVLSAAGQQRSLSARGKKRTYSWPSSTVIKAATVEALGAIAADSGPAMRELLGAAGP